jgi:hypothetical protein
MVNKEVVLKTIKKMISSGINEDAISSSLKNLGLGEGQIQELLSEAKTQMQEKVKGESEEIVPQSDEIARKTSQRVQEHLSEKAEADLLRETSTSIQLDEHGDMLQRLEDKIDSLGEKFASPNESAFDSTLVKKVELLDKKLKELEKDLKDVNARTEAVHSLMKKVLDTDREILTKISKKK